MQVILDSLIISKIATESISQLVIETMINGTSVPLRGIMDTTVPIVDGGSEVAIIAI